MNRKTIKKLEYTKILKLAAKYAVSAAGKEQILQLHPETEPRRVKRMLNELDEVVRFLSSTAKNPVEYFTDVKKYVEKVKIGGVLRPDELLNVMGVCKSAINAKNIILESDVVEDLPFLKDLAVNIYNCKTVISEISNAITPEAEIADGASSELRQIRRELRQQNANVRAILERLIRSQSISKYLQDAVVTERNGRFVIPVKSEFRSMVPGIIHDQSSTGSTVFIEPAGVVEAKNEISRLEAAQKHEEERILGEISRNVKGSGADICDNQDVLERLDVLFAKAGFCNAFDCVKPDICDKLCIRISKGRHPLLNPETCVPIDVTIGDGFKTLIITGPNTGGKTVSLKTVGLFILLCQSGFFLPAYRVTMGIFDDVVCDIGDEQAIEQNLSTFSSHMTNVVSIITGLRANTMVLFDELCTGTDPVEGSALARAILTEISKKHVLTFATTHYSELKTYAFETEGMENASMEFDLETLRPTYRLVVGIPGKSNALEISRKLGLPDVVIESAQNTMNKDELNVNRLIADIEHNNLMAQKAREDAEKSKEEAEQLKRYYEEKTAQIAQKRQQEIEKAKEQAAQIISEAESEAKDIIKELRYNTDGLAGKDKNELIENSRKRLQDKKKQYETAKVVEKKVGLTADKVRPGMTVWVGHLANNGTVLSITGDEVLLQVGILKLKAKLNELELPKEDKVEEKKSRVPSEHKKIELKASTISSTLDMRGLTAEDAYIEIDRYIDAALTAGMEEVTLLHGKGTGALRSAVHEYLRKHKRCEKFRIGKYGEGDTGVTIVTLK